MASRAVLIVDDDPGIRDSLAECLASEGYEVLAAPNGVDALDRVRERRPDLIVVDLHMPVMNGAQLVERLRDGEATRGIPVILMSGLQPGGREPLPAVAAVLPKPFELDDLIETVARFA